MRKAMFLVTGALALWCAQVVFAGLEQAEVAFLKGDYGLAIKNCDSSAAGDYLKARVLLKENRVQEAREVFQKILVEFPSNELNDAVQLGLADTYFSDEKYEDAIGEYRKIEERYGQSRFAAIALYKMGRSHLKLNQMEQARFYFQKLQQNYPLSFEAKLIDEFDNSEFSNSVQVGCFSSYNNAEKLVNKLKDKNFDAYISEKEGSPVFYRVRVGKFKTASEAMACKATLERKGYKTKLCP